TSPHSESSLGQEGCQGQMEDRFLPPERLLIWPITGLPEVAAGAPLAEMIADRLAAQNLPVADRDVLVVAQKIVSKAEGRVVELARVKPSEYACSVGETYGKDPRQIEVILRESRR